MKPKPQYLPAVRKIVKEEVEEARAYSLPLHSIFDMRTKLEFDMT